MCDLDDNFDGKLAYSELRQHIDNLGFNITELEDREKLNPILESDEAEF